MIWTITYSIFRDTLFLIYLKHSLPVCLMCSMLDVFDVFWKCENNLFETRWLRSHNHRELVIRTRHILLPGCFTDMSTATNKLFFSFSWLDCQDQATCVEAQLLSREARLNNDLIGRSTLCKSNIQTMT